MLAGVSPAFVLKGAEAAFCLSGLEVEGFPLPAVLGRTSPLALFFWRFAWIGGKLVSGFIILVR